MAIQATVKLWTNQNLGLGHIAIELFDNSSNSYLYISWPQLNDMLSDQRKHKISPINIYLPPTNITFNEFIMRFKRTDYYISDELKRNLRSYNLGQINYHEIYSHLIDELEEYAASFNPLLNNSAHCVHKVLEYAGYSKLSFSKTLSTRPYTCALHCCNISNKYYLEYDIQQIINDQKLSTNQKISIIIDNIIKYLENSAIRKAVQTKGKNRELYSSDIKILREIINGDFNEIEIIIKLIKAASIIDSFVLTSLHLALELIDTKLLIQANQLLLHEILLNMIDDFILVKDIESADALKIIQQMLVNNYLEFINNDWDNFEKYIEKIQADLAQIEENETLNKNVKHIMEQVKSVLNNENFMLIEEFIIGNKILNNTDDSQQATPEHERLSVFTRFKNKIKINALRKISHKITNNNENKE